MNVKKRRRAYGLRYAPPRQKGFRGSFHEGSTHGALAFVLSSSETPISLRESFCTNMIYGKYVNNGGMSYLPKAELNGGFNVNYGGGSIGEKSRTVGESINYGRSNEMGLRSTRGGVVHKSCSAYRDPPSQNSIDYSSSSHGKPPYTSSGLNATTVSIGSSFGQLRLSRGKPTCSSETASQASETKTPDSPPQCSSFGLIDDLLSV
uniref:Uncharacterized protein n=1 Tax=Brassica campestris TaxID=3711 RepID=M4F1E2_BRACM